MLRWRWASASEIGTSHIKLGIRKQDALASFTVGDRGEIYCAIVCDGAGSAQFGGEGASIVCRTLSLAIRSHFHTTAELPADVEIWDWIDRTRDCLAVIAQKREAERRAFASTLILLIAKSNEQLTVHVGDGAIVARFKTGIWRALSWPENGEYASTTYFVTDDPAPKVKISRSSDEIDAFAIFSDGIENLALNMVTQTPHEPFFCSMIAPLDRLDTTGKNFALSDALTRFLAGPRVCEKTDDDKTLILTCMK